MSFLQPLWTCLLSCGVRKFFSKEPDEIKPDGLGLEGGRVLVA